MFFTRIHIFSRYLAQNFRILRRFSSHTSLGVLFSFFWTYSIFHNCAVFGGLKHVLNYREIARPQVEIIFRKKFTRKKHAVCIKLQTLEFSRDPRLHHAIDHVVLQAAWFKKSSKTIDTSDYLVNFF
jgi:hypothetical protein